MAPRPRSLSLSLLAAAVLAWLPPADAGATLIFQVWRDPLFATNGQEVQTTSVVDDSGLTGVGTEQVLLDALVANMFLFGAIQDSSRAVFSVPPSFSIEGNIIAEYVDGSFFRLRSVSLGGASLTQMVNSGTGQDFGVRLNVNGGILNYGLPIPQINRYNLVTTTVTPTPEPGTLSLLALGLGALVLRRRRA